MAIAKRPYKQVNLKIEDWETINGLKEIIEEQSIVPNPSISDVIMLSVYHYIKEVNNENETTK
jgi:hypothetical protein